MEPFGELRERVPISHGTGRTALRVRGLEAERAGARPPAGVTVPPPTAEPRQTLRCALLASPCLCPFLLLCKPLPHSPHREYLCVQQAELDYLSGRHTDTRRNSRLVRPLPAPCHPSSLGGCKDGLPHPCPRPASRV